MDKQETSLRIFSRLATISTVLALTAGVAEAAAVNTLFVSGVIVHDRAKMAVDTYGLFGPAGADLTGAQISVFEQYEPAAFNSAQLCGEACQYYLAKSPYSDLYGAVLIVVTVNGVQRVYNSGKAGTVEISDQLGDSTVSEINLSAADLSGNKVGIGAQFPTGSTFQAPFPVASIKQSSPLLGSASLPGPSGMNENLYFRAHKATH